MQQALGYAEILQVPSVFSSNGDAFASHNKVSLDGEDIETQFPLESFPPPDDIWKRYKSYRGMENEDERLLIEPYHTDSSGKEPRYYQVEAINRTIEAVTRGQKRVLLVMATGTGKTYTTFQIIWRLWKAKAASRILFLADRNILVDQTLTNDFKPFGAAMAKVKNRKIDPAYEIHLGLYQAITGPDEEDKIFKNVSRDFFDMIVIDECHRGSAADDSAWREILEYFNNAVLNKDTWLKGDMIYTVGFHRLDLVKLRGRHPVTGKRLYWHDRISRNFMKQIYGCVLNGSGLTNLPRYL